MEEFVDIFNKHRSLGVIRLAEAARISFENVMAERDRKERKKKANPEPPCLPEEQTKRRELDAKEKAKGRSPGYWDMDPRDQWAEDKRLGILDWDGN